MVKIDEQLTKKIARLAAIRLSDDEVKNFTPQLLTILDYVEQLNEVEVKKIEPMIHPVDIELPLREDQAEKPRKPNDGFKVPQII